MSLRTRAAVALLAGAVTFSACDSREVRLGEPTSTPAMPTPTEALPTDGPVTPTPDVAPTATPSPTTPEPTESAPPLFQPGEPAVVTQGGEDYVEVTVTKVSEKKRYGSGYTVDTPARGNVYIEAYVTYRALADGAAYNPFDWQVFCNDTAIDGFTFLLSGPEPQLGSGTLPKGRKASGWLVYEVPAKGRCLLSYGANQFLGTGAVFEVLLRAS